MVEVVLPKYRELNRGRFGAELLYGKEVAEAANPQSLVAAHD